MADRTSALAQLGAQPITLESPCGESARYEPEYDRLEAEIAKLESLSPQGTAEPVDWGQVIDLGSVILREKSKDLLVASYLSRGLFEHHGYAGLEAALTIYCDLLEGFWDGLFPEKKRKRGRVAAIDWMVERLGSAVTKRDLIASEHEALTHCRALMDRLQLVLQDTLELDEKEAQELLSSLARPLRERSANVASPTPASDAPPPASPATDETPAGTEETRPAEETSVIATPATEDMAPEPQEVAQRQGEQQAPASAAQEMAPTTPDAAPETRPTAPSAASAATTVPTTFESESDVQKALRASQTVLRNAAAFWLSKNLANPVPYRLVRMSTWMLVGQLPQHQDQVTQISRPQPEVVQGYEGTLQQGHHDRVIPEVEAHFARAPFWLDAHRLTAMALEALGPTHAEAKRTVVVELASFLRRLPEVLDLKFADGTPFADERTRAWIDHEVIIRPMSDVVQEVPLPRRSVGELRTSDTDGAHPAPWLQVREEANHLAAAGQVIAGAALFQPGLQQAASKRERFMWCLQQARFCYDVGTLEAAIPQLEFLLEQGERYALDEWEPALSLEVVQLLLRCYYTLVQKIKKPTPDLIEKAERLYAHLCRLDVTAALVMDERV